MAKGPGGRAGLENKKEEGNQNPYIRVTIRVDLRLDKPFCEAAPAAPGPAWKV